MYQAPVANLRNSVRAPTYDAAVPDLRAGERDRGPPSAALVRWPVSVGFFWSLATTALLLVITTVVVTVADGDLFIIWLVPGLIGAAMMGSLVTARRPARPMATMFFGDRGAPYAAMARLGRQGGGGDHGRASAQLGGHGGGRQPAAALRRGAAADRGRLGAPRGLGAAPAEVVAFPLTFQRETVGRLLVGQRAAGERLSPDDERLLVNLARQVAPAAHAVALREALDASRAGLAAAREEERRRLRRDLHDGLGSAIAGLTLGLDTACAMSAGRRELEELLCKLKAESQRAVTDIRRIVYGLRPPALDELGLTGALREEVTRLERQAPGLSITLHLPGQGLDGLLRGRGGGRLPDRGRGAHQRTPTCPRALL